MTKEQRKQVVKLVMDAMRWSDSENIFTNEELRDDAEYCVDKIEEILK